MQLDMTKAQLPQTEQEQPAQVVQEKNKTYNLTLTQEELDVIKKALLKSKSVETFVHYIEGQKEYELLVDLEKIK